MIVAKKRVASQADSCEIMDPTKNYEPISYPTTTFQVLDGVLKLGQAKSVCSTSSLTQG